MKTTVDLPDPFLDEARRLAAREGATLDVLVERGLRHVLADPAVGTGFKSRKASFKGEGSQPDAARASWSELRALAYGGRGRS